MEEEVVVMEEEEVKMRKEGGYKLKSSWEMVLEVLLG